MSFDREAGLFEIFTEMPEDYAEVEALYDSCFGPGRTGLSSYRLRENIAPIADLCLLIRDETGGVAGAIRYWPVKIGGHETLLLGPIAIHPTHQGEGLGAWLIKESLERAALNWARVVLVGDEPYYARFGFHKAPATLQFPPPTNADRVLILALKEGGFSNVAGEVTKFSAE